MPTPPKNIKETYPLPVYNYKVSVIEEGNSPSKGESVGFAQVSGLNIHYEKVEYRHGASYKEGPVLLTGVQNTFQIVLSKGVAWKGSFLYDWIHPAGGEGILPPVPRDLLVMLCDEQGQPLVSWSVFGALPYKLEAPRFDAAASEVAIETLELAAPKVIVNYNVQ